MKILSVLAIAILLTACASLPSSEVAIPQKFVLEIKGVDSVKVEEPSTDRISKAMEVPNPEGRLSHLTFLLDGYAHVKIFSGISVTDVTNFWNDVCVLESMGIKKIKLFINSPGGDAFSGLALADEIERARRSGFKVTAYASGIIASATVPIFAVCDTRIAAPGTIFMVHEAAIWKWPGRETASDIRSQNDLMILLRTHYIGKLVAHSKLSESEWEGLERKTTWFSAQTALEYGLVDKIE